MRIVIDLQGAQSSGSRNRGIGRYSTALALGMCRNRGDHEILLALNGVFEESVDEIRLQFANILPDDAIRVFHPLPNVHSLDDTRQTQREISEMAWEAFLASLEPDVVHVSSVFEGLSDDAVTNIGAYGYGTHLTAVTLYDLIPLINHEHYLANPVIDRWYRRKIENLQRADLLLAISESSRQEGLAHLHFTEQQIVNISTAADPHFQRINLSEVEQAELRERYGINRPFVMYTGGIDYRKNIEGLIAAYALLPAELRSGFSLAVVCACHAADRERLLKLAKDAGLLPGDLVLTGFVPEDDLIALYSSCSLFVFPSWHEGFGLPALEAMWCGAPVIGSNRSSLVEVIGWDDAMFDPFDSLSIANKMQQGLTDEAFTKALVKHGKKQRRKFSWDRSAKNALTAIERLWLKSSNKTAPPTSTDKPTLAYVSPLPPARSGIAEYSAELIPLLAHYYTLDLVVPDGFDFSQTPREIHETVRSIISVDTFELDSLIYDRVLYHFGNSDHHTHMFGLLAKFPGVVVLHDFFLSGILSYWEHHLSQPNAFSTALYTSHGYPALVAMNQPGGIEKSMWIYPSNRQVLDDADGIIVHSENSRLLARQWIGESCANRFALIPHLRVPETDLDSLAARERLGLAPDAVLICSFGIMGATKHNRAILDAWLASSAARDPSVHLVFVGQKDGGGYGASIDNVIAASGKSDRIHITGWTDLPEFRDYLRAADVAVQLRTLSRGETSGTILDCMNFGLPVIVNANGSMADIPADCVIKLEDEFAQKDLVAAIDDLALNRDLRNALGQRGRKLIETAHDPVHCAALYCAAIETFFSRAQSSPLHLAARIKNDYGATLNDADFRLLAERLDWNAPRNNVDGRILISIPTSQGKGGGAAWRQNPLMKALRELTYAAAMPRIEPIYWCEDSGAFRYARKLMLDLLDLPLEMLSDDIVDFRIGDFLVDLDDGHRSVSHTDGLAKVRRRVTISYHAFFTSPSARVNKGASLPRSIQSISSRLMNAGWHSVE